MLFRFLILYYFYTFIYNLYFKLTIYTKIIYLINDTVHLMTLINIYESYIDYVYNDLNSKKDICLTFELINNRKFIAKISNICKINCDIVIFTSRPEFSPLYSDIINIIVHPNKKPNLYLYFILNKRLPREIVNYIGDYICDCKLCKNIIYPI